MITGAAKNKVDAIWQKMWEGGITNPLDVISNLTYLMFMRSLDYWQEPLQIDVPSFFLLHPRSSEHLYLINGMYSLFICRKADGTLS